MPSSLTTDNVGVKCDHTLDSDQILDIVTLSVTSRRVLSGARFEVSVFFLNGCWTLLQLDAPHVHFKMLFTFVSDFSGLVAETCLCMCFVLSISNVFAGVNSDIRRFDISRQSPKN